MSTSLVKELNSVLKSKKKVHLVKTLSDSDRQLSEGYAERLSQSKYFKDNTVIAEVSQYAAWLKGFLDNGGEITDYYDCDMPKNFLMMKERGSPLIALPPSYGDRVVNFICFVYGYKAGDMGHGNAYILDGDKYTHLGQSVPLYRDVAVYLDASKE